jgi:hypothetical protein
LKSTAIGTGVAARAADNTNAVLTARFGLKRGASTHGQTLASRMRVLDIGSTQAVLPRAVLSVSHSHAQSRIPTLPRCVPAVLPT